MLHQPIEAPAEDRAGARGWTTRRLLYAVLAIWAAAIPTMLALHGHGVAQRSYPDPDDELRLLEVRDWLAGQSFWDVSQHRVNPPWGGPMHWSRIVDAPIALVELLLRPLLGAAGAEFGAALVVPMLTLLVVLATVAIVGRRLAGAPAALLAAALVPTLIGFTVQVQPLRVDHHGWEIACVLIALAGAIGPARRGGVVAGLALAVALQISLEQLPFAAAVGGVVASRWIVSGDETSGRRLAAFAVTLAAAEAALFALLHASATWSVAWCDAVSWPHLLALAILAATAVAATRAAPATAAVRAGVLAIAGGAAVAAVHAVPPHCGLDAFSALGPLEKRLWLDNIREGLPVWRSGALGAIGATGFPLLGLACTLPATRNARGADREAWLCYAVLLLVATVVGVLVMRACALSNVLALVPVTRAMVLLLRRVGRSGSAVVRVVGSASVVIALSPWTPAVIAAATLPETSPPDVAKPSDCKTPAAYRALAMLPAARFLAPVDFGPALMLNTPHSVLATGHHRSHAAIADELRAMTGSDAVAERIVRAHGIGYVLACPEMGEFSVYAREAPQGLGARLARGQSPDWLRRVRLPGSGLMLWRVSPGQPPAGLPSSRSAGGSVPAPAQISRRADFSPSS